MTGTDYDQEEKGRLGRRRQAAESLEFLSPIFP